MVRWSAEEVDAVDQPVADPFEELLRSQGVLPRKGAASLLLALRTAGIRTAAVCTSRREALLLDRAGAADLVDVCVDAGTRRIRARRSA